MSTLKVNTINASTSGQAVDVDIKNPKSFRNKVINGGMLVNQRGNQSSVTTSVYGLDRFKVQEVAAVTYDINQSTDTPNGFGNSFHIDIQGANSSPAASHYMQLITPLEGFDVQDFAKGTAEAKEYAVSFYIKTNVTGNYALQITDDNSRSCSQLYTVSDTNWNRYTVIFPADTTGAIDNDNTEGLRLTWHLLVGSNQTSGTMNTTWAATTTANIAVGQNANVASSTSNNWYITGVQLEVGSVVTDFEHKSFAEDLRLCCRYFYAATDVIAGIFICDNADQDAAYGGVQFPVIMRAAPTVVLGDNAGNNAGVVTQHGAAHGIAAAAGDIGKHGIGKVQKSSGNWDTGSAKPIAAKIASASAEL